jgi:hypothetical protein
LQSILDIPREGSGSNVRHPAQDADFELRTSHPSGYRSLHYLRAAPAGAVLARFDISNLTANPSYLSVQVSEDQHILLSPSFLESVNHSCDPNAFFCVSSGEFRSVKDISAGDEISFFYPSTEWRMVRPFQCACASEACLVTIRGAAYIEGDVLRRYQLNPHIVELMRRQRAAPADA